jgi:UDP-N-acetyl-D-glucosamine/UDP-N-acetyl-D-galactosamine dehydrogenase
MKQENMKLAVIGLGYVGLPLAAEFAKQRTVMGFDINKERIEELRRGFDQTNELNSEELSKAKGLQLSNEIESIKDCDCYIITVPTPVDSQNSPDLSALLSASAIVGDVLSKGNIVIYESTVYPGATEEDCAPILSKRSGLSYGTVTMPMNGNVYYLGYSSERINPGDKKHRITDIVKITSGSTPEIAEIINELYASIIKAGTYKAESIRIAEAAKIIENTQRDVNIALVNELAVIFEKLDLDTEAILKAARTKWNFLPFEPGLVGGHCIGVDPYYLTHKAKQVGYKPEIILAGRKINDAMPSYLAERTIKLMLNKNINILGSRILVLGLTFKENCSDTRNSKVINMINSLVSYKCIIDAYDPLVKKINTPSDLDFKFVTSLEKGGYDAIILAVKHDIFSKIGAAKIRECGKVNHVFFDLKHAFSRLESDDRL